MDCSASFVKLVKAVIRTLLHYSISPHLQAAYANLGIPPGILLVARDMASEVLSLLMAPHLAKAEAEKMIAAWVKVS